jgi:hypothetical protein
VSHSCDEVMFIDQHPFYIIVVLMELANDGEL